MTKPKLNSVELILERNSLENDKYYNDLTDFFTRDVQDPLQALKSFALYVPRQFLTDFLVRYELFKLVEEVSGSIFEFGVMNGQGLLSMAQFSAILEPSYLNREIVGFDTFEGFPSPTQEDGRSSVVSEGGFNVSGSEERIKEAINLFDRNRFLGHVSKVKVIKGDVTTSLAEYLAANPHSIAALVYMDLDLYEPTKCVLEQIMDIVPRGGVVVFDQINHRSFPGETLGLKDTLGISKVGLKRLPFCSRISYFVR